MANRHDLLIRLDSEFSDKGFRSAEQSAKTLERELNKQEAAERSLANMQMAAQREEQARRAAQLQGMTQVGRGFTAVGLLAAAGLGLAGKAAMDWETAWAGVTKTVSGSADEMAVLETQLRGLARTLPVTHEEIAGVAEAAGQLGVQRKDIAAFTKTMIDLGVSTNLSAEDAATGIAQISNVMGTLAREGTQGISRFGATLVALGNAGASTERDILEMAARLAGAGKMIGASESDVLALSNAMSSLGIEAELGGGAMSRTLIKINSAVKEGGDNLDKFARVSGLSATAFAAKWKSDPISAVDLFIKGLARVNSSGGDAAATLNDLGLKGTQNAQVLLRLTGAGDSLTQSLALGNQAWQQNTALVNEANKRYETTASRVKIARNQLNDAAIDIGANVLPAFAGVAERVGVLAEAFHGLPGPVKEAVTILGGIVVTVGLVGGAALMLIPKLIAMNATLASSGAAGAAASRGLSAVGSAMKGPWGIALAGATIGLGVFAEKQMQAKQKADDFRASLDQTTGALTDQSRAMVAADLQQNGMLDNYGGLVGGLKELTDVTLGNEDALNRLHSAQKANEDTLTRLAAKHGDLTDAEYAELDAAQQRSNAYTHLFEQIKPMTGAYDEQIAKQRELASVTKDGSDATNSQSAAAAEAKIATQQLASANEMSAKAAEEARKELDDLISSIENYGDTVNKALDATSGYEAALDDATAAVAKNGKTANKARTEINLHTEAGRANDKALRDVANSALKAATANFQNGRSVKSVTADVVSARGKFINLATGMGLSKTAANRLADSLGLTKGNVSRLNAEIAKTPTSKTTKMTVQTAAAVASLKALQSRINGLRGGDVKITTRYVTIGNPNGGKNTGGGTTKDAMGSIHEFAGGGYAPIGPQYPQIRQAGGAGMTWAEHGAGPWEAYISGNPDKRDRSLAIWQDTGRRLGAFEAMRSQPSVTVAGATHVDRSTHVVAYGHDAASVARELRKQQAKDEALNPNWGG